MRGRTASVAILMGCVGCASIVGLDFDDYREKPTLPPAQTQCVPNTISRCLCELDEGVRGCDDQGRFLPCVCDAGGATSVCGNGRLEPGEACDDGDRQDGNGCSARCVPDGRLSAVNQCPGQAVVAWPGTQHSFQVQGSIRTADPDAGACGAGAPPDRIFALTTSQAGTLDVAVTASVRTFVSVRTTCDDPASVRTCELRQAGETARFSFDLGAGKEMFLVLQPVERSETATFAIEVVQP
jgi:cysteine-rich repeat protein